jgi:chemotaxis protein methyltransferase CheR
MLSAAQFDRIRSLALRLAGIEMTERHQGWLERRGPGVGRGSVWDWDALLDAAERGDPVGRGCFIERVTTRYTRFFRNPDQLSAAAVHAEHAVRRRGSARLWSAGTSTGEEAYSLAWVTRDADRDGDGGVVVLATDIDEGALAFASAGRYSTAALEDVEPAVRAGLFESTERADFMQVAPEVKRRVEFRRLNLADLVWPVIGLFDVIFCRNVLMYFDPSYRYAVLERLASHLAPEALLVLDPAEHLGRAAPHFQPQGRGLWRRRSAAGLRWVPVETGAALEKGMVS